MEVCTVSGQGHVSCLYPPHYKTAFAFSILLYPQYQQSSLRLTCLHFCRQHYGLTEFHFSDTSGEGTAYSPVTFVSAYTQCKRV